MSANWEVQKAVYSTLKTDTTFTNLVSTIVDEPDTNKDYPYVLIGEGTENPDDNHSTLGYETFLNLIIYTKPAGLGYYTATQILTRMNALLNTKRLTLDSLRMLICVYDNSSKFRNKDIRGINVRYKILTAETSQFTI